MAQRRAGGSDGPTDRGAWVGIGASAGGLEALRDLVRALSPDLEATYIVLQHMSPQHKSLLPELIGRVTPLPVVEIADGQEPAPGVIHVAPPNRDVVVTAGRLRLVAPGRGPAIPKPSVDRFFVSLAEELGPNAVGIVLSGTGTDGAYGIQAIRAAGGITIAQDRESAKYDGMPAAAVETGGVDLILPPAEIARQLGRILRTPRDRDGNLIPDIESPHVDDLLRILQARCRVDFRDYKPSTVLRRIHRRMDALGMATLEAYADRLRREPEEVDALFRDMLISVTRFFRDRAEFEALERHLGTLIEERSGERPLRVWVAGCATGEEAYGIAILMIEALGGLDRLEPGSLQVFATDLDAAALRIARGGRFGAGIVQDVPDALLERYFRHDGDGYRILPAVQACVLFSEHNVAQDPPFLNLDLVCCRNLLIYFGDRLQRRVLGRFEFALRVGGLLFLGTAETVSDPELAFRPVAGSSHIFRKRPETGPPRRLRRIAGLETPRPDAAGSLALERSLRETQAMFDALVRGVGPDAMLVTADLRILRVFGDVSRFVALRDMARPQMTLSMLREDLLAEARSLIALALRSGQPRMGLARAEPGSENRAMRMGAYPLGTDGDGNGIALLAFPAHAGPLTDPAALPPGAEGVSSLQREVRTTRDALQAAIEELEISNEQLQTLNAELQATNEELQSANEELETTNEELQSTNEELITVNEEQQIGAAELAMLSEELRAVLLTIPTPVLVVDSALQITLASAAAEALFDRSIGGRPHVAALPLSRAGTDMTELLTEVLRNRMPCATVMTIAGRNHVVRLAPFVDARERLLGASVVFVETPIPEGSDILGWFCETAPGPAMLCDAEERVRAANTAFSRLTGQDAGKVVGETLDSVLARHDGGGMRLALDRLQLVEPGTGTRAILVTLRPTEG